MPSSSKNTDSEVVRPASPASDSVVRSAGVVSIAIAMSRVTGLIRESVMSRLFGAGAVMDAFNLGFRPTIIAATTATRDLPGPDGAVVPAATLQSASLAAVADLVAFVKPSVADIPA